MNLRLGGRGPLPCRAGRRSRHTGQHDSLSPADLGFLLTEGTGFLERGAGREGREVQPEGPGARPCVAQMP